MVWEGVWVVECEVVHTANEDLFEVVGVDVGDEDDGCEEETAGLGSTYNVAVELGVVCGCDVLCNLCTVLVLGHQAAAVPLHSPRAVGRPAGVGPSV